MSFVLASQLSERIAAIAPVAGFMSDWLPTDGNPQRAVPVLMINGTADTLDLWDGKKGYISVEQSLDYWVNFNACTECDTISLPDLDPTDGCTVEKITHTNCISNSSVVLFKVIGGGHTWPGTHYSPYEAMLGNLTYDISADEEIWNFFKNYELPEITNVESDSNIPIGFSLSQNYPNPFNSTTTIEYSVPCGCRTSLKIFNSSGQLVATLKDEIKSAGSYSAVWDASGMPSGIYFCTLKSGDFVQTKEMLFLK